jgi:tetratricopeptide (TPR) repeat protein
VATLDFGMAVRDATLIMNEPSEEVAAAPRTMVPALVSTTFSEGLELLNRGEASAAAACFEQIVEMVPEYADAHVGLGIAYAVRGRVYPALDHLEEATNLEPNNFFAHFKLGQLYFKLHVPKKGYDEMREALDCATSVGERKLVGQLIHEQKQREEKGLARPTWNRTFSRRTMWLLAASVVVPMLYMFYIYAH